MAIDGSFEVSFRVAVVVVFAVTLLVAAFYRLQASQSGERISHREEGYLFTVVLRLAGLAVFAWTLLYLIQPTWLGWASMPIVTWLRWTGAITGILCSALMLWTLSSLGKNLTDTVVTRQDATLVTDGPYRWVRHPFYVTTGLLMASVTLLSANALIGISSAVVLSLLALRTPKEEQMLIDRFGDDYRNYMAQVGRFWPKW